MANAQIMTKQIQSMLSFQPLAKLKADFMATDQSCLLHILLSFGMVLT